MTPVRRGLRESRVTWQRLEAAPRIAEIDAILAGVR